MMSIQQLQQTARSHGGFNALWAGRDVSCVSPPPTSTCDNWSTSRKDGTEKGSGVVSGNDSRLPTLFHRPDRVEDLGEQLVGVEEAALRLGLGPDGLLLDGPIDAGEAIAIVGPDAGLASADRREIGVGECGRKGMASGAEVR
jgi:hypothetical protein